MKVRTSSSINASLIIGFIFVVLSFVFLVFEVSRNNEISSNIEAVRDRIAAKTIKKNDMDVEIAKRITPESVLHQGKVQNISFTQMTTSTVWSASVK